MRFPVTDRMFDLHGRRDNFASLLLPKRDRPLKYLELGVFLGASIEWIASNVLLHDESSAIGIDAWLPTPKKKTHRFRWTAELMAANMDAARNRVARFGSKVQLIQSLSSIWLRTCGLPAHSLDVIYIDADHEPLAVLDDTALTWPLLKVGGIMIWDDYVHPEGFESIKPSIDCLMGILGPHCKPLPLLSSVQYAVEKLSDYQCPLPLPNGEPRPPGMPIA